MATIFDSGEFDEPKHDPPTNPSGTFVCARACRDGSRCMANVALPYMACYQHDRSAPIVREDRDGEITPNQ